MARLRFLTTAAAVLALAGAAAPPSALAAAARAQAATKTDAAMAHPSRALWLDMKSAPATSANGAKAAVSAKKLRAMTLDRSSIAAMVAGAPMEFTEAARSNPVVLSLPAPDGSFQRFAIVESPVMEPGLAAKHPEIKTYAGRGIDDTGATLRMDISPIGFHASVRSQKGAWYIDPFYQKDDSLYASFYRRDVPRPSTFLKEGLLNEGQLVVARGAYRAGETVEVRGAGFAPGALVAITVRGQGDVAPRQLVHATASADGTVSARLKADPYKATGRYTVTASDGRTSADGAYEVRAEGVSLDASTGPVLRVYRLALLSDPGYANYHGAANVTAAKVALINRVTQVYEYETSIRLVLIASNDNLNLNTAAQFSGVNGPCGATACFPTASVSCTSAVLTRNRQVIGLLVGASNFDIGHIGVGAGGGGIASLGVVGGNNKAQGCTGLPTPVGDLFAVDYVAHEMGHQFAGNHTFNGTAGSCSGGNRSAANSIEPGSGSSIMAYAGICSATDDLQPHSDPYWSARSFDEITTYVNGAETNINEIQMAVLSGFTTNGQQFNLRYNGNDSVPIVRGTNFTTTDVQNAIQGIAGWPAGATVTVSALTDATFTITFGGTLAGINADQLQLVNCTSGCTGYVGELAKGGITTRGGSTITPTGNNPPVVSVAGSSFTIPLRTPFALTGSATDPDGDVVTYMWEQIDRGGSTGTSLFSNTKTNGPLFRQFGTRAIVSSSDTLLYNSPGENAVNTNPTRVFPDMAQILANNTNAETGTCPATGVQVDCFSEFLPTIDYVGFAGVNASPLALNFKLTGRDSKGGVNSATTQLLLATGAGPFRVTGPGAGTVDGGSPLAISWSVANTNAAPVNTANVKISLSTDSGATFPVVLAASVPNTGSANLLIPNINTTTARLKIEAVGNVFFDVSHADFGIRLTGDVNGDGSVGCPDLAIIRGAFGTVVGQPGFDPRADVNNDGVIDLRDLAYVSQRVTVGVRCST